MSAMPHPLDAVTRGLFPDQPGCAKNLFLARLTSLSVAESEQVFEFSASRVLIFFGREAA
jgi:hypothetical protein